MYIQDQIDREHELLTAALARGDVENAAAHARLIRAYSREKQKTETRVSVLAGDMVGVRA